MSECVLLTHIHMCLCVIHVVLSILTSLSFADTCMSLKMEALKIEISCLLFCVCVCESECISVCVCVCVCACACVSV